MWIWVDSTEPPESTMWGVIHRLTCQQHRHRVDVLVSGKEVLSQSGTCRTGFDALMTLHSLLNATQGSVTDPLPRTITQTNDSVYQCALSMSTMLHDKLYLPQPLLLPGVSSLRIFGQWELYIYKWMINSLLHLTLYALWKVALPCHEGPHRPGGQRGWIHPEQTASRGRPQTCRVWGIHFGNLSCSWNETLKLGDEWKCWTKESIISSSISHRCFSEFKFYPLLRRKNIFSVFWLSLNKSCVHETATHLYMFSNHVPLCPHEDKLLTRFSLRSLITGTKGICQQY